MLNTLELRGFRGFKSYAIQKMRPSLEHAVRFAGEQIAIAVDQEIDLR